MNRTRILLADDHAATLQRWRALLEPEFEVITERDKIRCPAPVSPARDADNQTKRIPTFRAAIGLCGNVFAPTCRD